MILRVAAKAVIVNLEGNVLILRESCEDPENTRSGQYQIPGGRIEAGESFTEGLAREVLEETGLIIEKVIKPIFIEEWYPVIKGNPHQIVGIFMLVLVGSGDVRLSLEHDDFQWINPSEWEAYPIMEQDARAVQAYAASLRG